MNATLPAPGALLRAWIDRRAPRGRSLRLRYRRIYILPTRAGAVFALMLLAVWVGAVNYSNNMAFLLCFLLVGFALISILHVFRNLQGLQLTAGAPAAVFAGHTAHFPVQLEDRSSRARHALVLRTGKDADTVASVAADGRRTVELPVPTKERGRVTLPTVVVETVFPAGLFRAWSHIRLEATCLVYPTPETGPVPAPESEDGTGSGRSAGRGDDDFIGLRPYQPADPLKRIAWRTLASGQELQTKQFAGESLSNVWLDYRTTQHLSPEARLSRLCRWILDAHQQTRPYGLRLPGETFQPATGETHRTRCLDALAQFPQ